MKNIDLTESSVITAQNTTDISILVVDKGLPTEEALGTVHFKKGTRSIGDGLGKIEQDTFDAMQSEIEYYAKYKKQKR